MTDKSVAIEILRQLGGNRFIAMTGSKNFACDDNSMSMQLTRNKLKARFLKITLTPMDVYKLEFMTLKNDQVITLKTVNNVYNDMLQNVFTNETGLNTSL